MLSKNPDQLETLACLIIDDPLLRPKYGCLSYARLLEQMKTHRFFTEIAFIPWNFRRSDPKTIQLFKDNPDYFGMCVHGCNHLDNEFGRGTYPELSALASTAMWRMDGHQKLTGLTYDPVFVFPQGHFSSLAMQALKDQGFLAACNTILETTDGEKPPEIEFHLPATRHYHDFPLFLRRYPHDKALYPQDIAEGRPVLIVEHHTAFRHGYRAITDLVDWINSSGNIRWTSLGHIAEHYTGNRVVSTIPVAHPGPTNLLLDIKTGLRRYLSEVRDNYFETNDLLNQVFRAIKK